MKRNIILTGADHKKGVYTVDMVGHYFEFYNFSTDKKKVFRDMRACDLPESYSLADRYNVCIWTPQECSLIQYLEGCKIRVGCDISEAAMQLGHDALNVYHSGNHIMPYDISDKLADVYCSNLFRFLSMHNLLPKYLTVDGEVRIPISRNYDTGVYKVACWKVRKHGLDSGIARLKICG